MLCATACVCSWHSQARRQTVVHCTGEVAALAGSGGRLLSWVALVVDALSDCGRWVSRLDAVPWGAVVTLCVDLTVHLCTGLNKQL